MSRNDGAGEDVRRAFLTLFCYILRPSASFWQPDLVTCIERHLQPEGMFFMQSDVLEVLQDMRVITRETAGNL